MLDRARLPALDDYCQAVGLAHRSGRGNAQRFDCPLAEHSRRGNLAITVDRGLWCCHGGCGGGDVIDLHMRRTGLSFAEAVEDLGADDGHARQEAPGSTIGRAPVSRPEPKPDRAAEAESSRKAQRASAVWQAAQSIAGTPVAEYLFGRAGTLPPADCTDIRFVPDLQIFGFGGPAMIGRISAAGDAAHGQGLHITWIERCDGRWRRKERRYLGRKAGGVVRLWPDEAVTWSVAIAEGIETALAASHLHRPVWACLDAGNLAAFPVLSGIESLTIFADNDVSGTGQRAAADCAERWLEAGREVTVFASVTAGHDIADEGGGVNVVQMNVEQLRQAADAAKPERRPQRTNFRGRGPRDATPSPSLPVRLDLAALSASEPARPRFIVDEMLPVGYATLFAGDGGTGKSALALYLAVCVALGRPVWGMPTVRVPVMFLSFEDRADVLHWRLAHITRHLGISIADLAGHLHLLDGVDVNATLFAFDPRKGRETTGLYEWVADQIQAAGARLLVVDGVSDVNAANENDRAAVKAFVRSMAQLTGPDGAVLLIGHVDKNSAKAGDTRQGYSGSTSWNNSVRARWYLRPETESDDDGNSIVVPGRLVLEMQKANLAPTGRAFGFAWSDEARMFLPDDAPARPAATAEAIRSGALHDWVVAACDEADAAGDAIPAALNGGQRTAWSVLTARLDCPAEFKGRPGRSRLAQVIEHLRSDRRLIAAGRRRANRHLRECLVTRDEPVFAGEES